MPNVTFNEPIKVSVSFASTTGETPKDTFWLEFDKHIGMVAGQSKEALGLLLNKSHFDSAYGKMPNEILVNGTTYLLMGSERIDGIEYLKWGCLLYGVIDVIYSKGSTIEKNMTVYKYYNGEFVSWGSAVDTNYRIYATETTQGVIEKFATKSAEMATLTEAMLDTAITDYIKPTFNNAKGIATRVDRIIDILEPYVKLKDQIEINVTKEMVVSSNIASAYIPAFSDPADNHLYVLKAVHNTAAEPKFIGMAYLNPIDRIGTTVKGDAITILGVNFATRFDKYGVPEFVSIGTDYTRVGAGSQLLLEEYEITHIYNAPEIKKVLNTIMS